MLVCVVLVAGMCGNCLCGAGFCVDGLCRKCLCVASLCRAGLCYKSLCGAGLGLDFWGAGFCTWTLLNGGMCISKCF